MKLSIRLVLIAAVAFISHPVCAVTPDSEIGDDGVARIKSQLKEPLLSLLASSEFTNFQELVRRIDAAQSAINTFKTETDGLLGQQVATPMQATETKLPVVAVAKDRPVPVATPVVVSTPVPESKPMPVAPVAAVVQSSAPATADAQAPKLLAVSVEPPAQPAPVAEPAPAVAMDIPAMPTESTDFTEVGIASGPASEPMPTPDTAAVVAPTVEPTPAPTATPVATPAPAPVDTQTPAPAQMPAGMPMI